MKKKNEQTDSAKRIEQIKCYLGISYKDISISIGQHEGTLTNLRSNGREISKSIAKALCEVYPELNYNWVLTGAGEMLTSPVANVRGNNNQVAQNNSQINNTTDTAGFLAALDKSQSHIDRLLAIIERMQGVAVVLLALLAFAPAAAQDTIRFKDGATAVMGEGVNRDYTIINENDTAVFVRHIAGGIAPISKSLIASVSYGLKPIVVAPPTPALNILDLTEMQTHGILLIWGGVELVVGGVGMLVASLNGWQPGNAETWRLWGVATGSLFTAGGVVCCSIGHHLKLNARAMGAGLTINL